MLPVYLIGLGMSPADLTPQARQIIAGAAVLAGGRRHLDYFADHPGAKIVLGQDLDRALEAIRSAAANRQVAVLASGDPFFYGLGRRLTDFLGPDNIVALPNVTAVQSACSLLKIPWDDAVVISLHGRDLAGLTAVLGRAPKIIIYTAGAATPAQIARLLLAPGLPAYRMCVLENLGAPGQQITWLHPTEVAARTFAPLNLVVLLQKPGAGVSGLHLGLPETALEHEAGLLTKTEVRAVVLAQLWLLPGHILWDIGAGCGSVGLEATLLVPGGRVLAVERQPERLRQIEANKNRYGAAALEVIDGEAPACLAGLPRPDRVFIGGGGPRLPQILEAARQQLQPQGRVVMTATLLETLHTANNILASWGWAVAISQVQVSRSRPLGQSMYFQALNPVWIITATPEAPAS